jgi:hypothetical protein
MTQVYTGGSGSFAKLPHQFVAVEVGETRSVPIAWKGGNIGRSD